LPDNLRVKGEIYGFEPKVVKESLEFQRGLDPKKAMRTGLMYTVELPVFNIEIDNETKKLDTSFEDTKYFANRLKKYNIKYEITSLVNGPHDTGQVDIELTGLKDDLIHIFVMFDAYGRSYKELKEVFANWYGDPEFVYENLY
jgi:hypothetical protein